MNYLLTILLICAALLMPLSAQAAYNPMRVSNNKVGIHVIDENGLYDAARLVNSSGGDWGYVTIVIREDERDTARWQRAFDKMRELHLIPLVRIASAQGTKGWTQSELSQIDEWVDFLDSLHWVTENRYIIVGNEPNHATEWDGELGPEEYADYLVAFSKKLKRSSSDYFVIQAGFDASAPTDRNHMSEETYIRRMVAHNERVFDVIDGWSSHSYPNPAFSGDATDTGRISIQGYKWELALLDSLGVNKDFPVFITETGWVNTTLTEDEIGQNFKYAYENVWNDEQVVAVTPFILDYPGVPFDAFSWRKQNGEYKSYYEEVKNLAKVQAEPPLSVTKPQNNRFKFVIGETGMVYNLLHNFWVS